MREHALPPEEKREFTLLSLLVVIAVVGIGLALLLPSLLRSRISVNEETTAGILKTLASSQAIYKHKHGSSYAPNIHVLESGDGIGGQPLLEPGFAEPRLIKSGYSVTMHLGAPQQRDGESHYLAWSAEAHPIIYGRTGFRSFYINERGDLRVADIQGAPGHRGMPLEGAWW